MTIDLSELDVNVKEENDDLQKYIDDLVEKGFILPDGTPLKCNCGGTEFEDVDEYFEGFCRCEYSEKCKSCGKIVGHWAYGHWELN